jgi:hypothetical protein
LILRQLGAVPLEADPPTEIVASDDVLHNAERALLARGDIQIDAEGVERLGSAVESIVRPVVFPDVACIVNIADVLTQGEFARITCFSRASQTFVISWVDNAQQHHFQVYRPDDAPAAAWDYLSQVCDLNVDAPSASVNGNRSEIERAMAQAKQTVLLMLITDVQSAEQCSSALSWFVSGRSAWLIEQQGTIDQPPHPASRNDLSRAAQAFVAQMFD